MIMDNYKALKVVKSERISEKKQEDRYVIIDESTGRVVDNACGHGFTSERAALSSYRWKHGNYKQAKPGIETWFIEHKEFFHDFSEALACFEKNGIPVDKKELMAEMLKSHGLEVEFNLKNMVRAWEASISTFQFTGKKRQVR